MTLDQLLAAFSRTYDLGNLSADKDGNYQLVFDDKVNVECRHEGPSVALLIARLAKLPDDPAQATAVLEKVMHHAYTRIKTCRLLLCMDKNRCLFAYQRLALNAMNAVAFDRALSHFVNQAEEFLQVAQAGAP